MNKTSLTRLAASIAAGSMLAGCAAVQNPTPSDPWEGFNRQVYSFNDSVDTVVLRPVASAYNYVTPQPVRSCINNMFSNVGDLWSATNSFLQGRGHDFVNTLGRFLFNTTMGVGGCFDVASTTGANKIPNDFGVTLGVWGFSQGPYVVLPILGPSSVRDGVGRVGDFAGNIASVGHIENVRLRNSLWGLQVVDTRAALIPTTDLIERTALDPYSFVRDAYLQRRNAQVLGRDAPADSNLPDYSVEDDESQAPAVPGQPGPATGGPKTPVPAAR
ncbi:VacJ family lipoprotein [Alcaligenaceae bacterium A4P071]|nr:VacJ family lipoprotein [Alcaligenaceae bacterium B3P038]MDQ2186461.1 VacJ family lipoprotein [Alcaligenaceae bacterium A4P071]